MSAGRIQAELQEKDKDLESLKGFVVDYGPVSDDDIWHWKASIIGVEGTPYEGGIYELSINLANTHPALTNSSLEYHGRYPFCPPKIKFLTKIYHASIDAEGNIDCDILGDQWSPSCTIRTTLVSIVSCLSSGGYPLQEQGSNETTSPNPVVMEMEEDLFKFMRTAVDWNHQHANGKSMKERNITMLQSGNYPKADVVNECLTEQFNIECSELLAGIICSFCLDYCIDDLPFSSYSPWINYVEKQAIKMEMDDNDDDDGKDEDDDFVDVQMVDRTD